MFDISFQGGQNNTSPSSNSGNQNNIPAMVASSNNPADESWYLDKLFKNIGKA